MAFASKIIEIFYIIPKIIINPRLDTKELLAEIFFSDKKHLVLKETKKHSDSNKEINSDAEKKAEKNAEALYEKIYGEQDTKEQTDTNCEDES